MTIEEAKEQLKDLIKDRESFLDGQDDEIYHRDIEVLGKAVKALEKQIPKKPLDICTPVVTWGFCPVCKGELNKLGRMPNRVFMSDAFCSDCGQAIDWSDEE